MTSIQQFNFRFAFLGENNKLLNQEPTGELEENKKLSILLAYCYLILRNPNSKIYVEPERSYNIQIELAELFPVTRIITEYDEDEEEMWTIDLIDTKDVNNKYTNGEFMMPIYVSNRNTFLYNLHKWGDKDILVDQNYSSYALNFFNCIYRSRNSGSLKVIWRDPVTGGTKVNEEYDYMFALFIADKYFTLMDPDYLIESNPEKKLAMCMSFVTHVTNMCSPKIKAEVKTIDIEIFKGLSVTRAKNLDIDVINTNFTLPKEDKQKGILTSHLYWIATVAEQYRHEATLLLTGYSDYSFLKPLLKITGLKSIIVYNKLQITGEELKIPEGIGMVKDAKVALNLQKDLKTLFSCGIAPEAPLLKSTIEGFIKAGGKTCMFITKRKWVPTSGYCFSFLSPFTSKNNPVMYMFTLDKKNFFGISDITSVTNSVVIDYINSQYRDTSRKYLLPKGDIEYTYDEVIYEYCVDVMKKDKTEEVAEKKQSRRKR